MENKRVLTVIENVTRFKDGGRIAYFGSAPGRKFLTIVFTKHFDHPSGKGYQRGTSKKHAKEFASFLSQEAPAIITPVLMNAGGKWEFKAYDPKRPNFGRLVCIEEPASMIDGQHRVEGIRELLKDSMSDEPTVPFVVFHYLSDEEEMHLFSIINSKHRGLQKSLLYYLDRDYSDSSWVATQLIVDSKSPFHEGGSITGERNQAKGIVFTIQNTRKLVDLACKSKKFNELSKEMKYKVLLEYFNTFRNTFPVEWENRKDFRLTHIVVLNALAILAASLFEQHTTNYGTVNTSKVSAAITSLAGLNFESVGDMKYLANMTGSRQLAAELIRQSLPPVHA